VKEGGANGGGEHGGAEEGEEGADDEERTASLVGKFFNPVIGHRLSLTLIGNG
jgi:hypothetical protein